MPSSPPAWLADLRAQGRSIAWLARELNVSRSHLAGVAAGTREASPELDLRIRHALAPPPIDRLHAIRHDAERQARWIRVRDAATELARLIARALEP